MHEQSSARFSWGATRTIPAGHLRTRTERKVVVATVYTPGGNPIEVYRFESGDVAIYDPQATVGFTFSKAGAETLIAAIRQAVTENV